MYEQLVAICERLRDDAAVRVATFRGAGGEAFVAGTDIAQFAAFENGEDGVAYERRIDHCIDTIASLPLPTLAVVEGWAVGGGIAIATACDFRIATDSARFAVPIARTLGNCLSIANLARLRDAFGTQRVKRMLMLAESLRADEALACGYLQRVCSRDEIDAVVAGLCDSLSQLAPITQGATKEGLRRLQVHDLPDGDDLVRRCYGSADFREGVRAFNAKRPPRWTGD
jgi:enoyl-CoA hydratase/carnithine racemase